MERGLVDAITNEEELRKAAEAGTLSVYCGFDPTADSLHLGNLLGILVLVWFQVRVSIHRGRTSFGVCETDASKTCPPPSRYPRPSCVDKKGRVGRTYACIRRSSAMVLW